MKYKVLITRREIYRHEVEVEAKNPLVAEDKVCRAYYNDEYASMLDCLADVETDFEVKGA